MRRFWLDSVAMPRALLIAVLFAVWAMAQEPPAYERGRIVERIATMSDPSITYAYYLPRWYDTGKRWPILYVFDPGKRGPYAADLFREAAETYGWIIVSSNDTDSSADWTWNGKALNAMWPDARKRFSVDPKRVYAAGMSGGAIMAWTLAKTSGGVVGVIGCSGRLADDHDADPVAFDWFGTAGTADFNYNETRLIESRLEAAHARYQVEIFDGNHRWPPAELLEEAVEWMELQAMRRSLRVCDEVFIRELFWRDMKRAESAGQLEAMRRYEAIVRTFDGLHDVDDARKKAEELRGRASVKRALKDERRAVEFEASAKMRMSRGIQAFIGDDAQPAAVLSNALDVAHLRKVAEGTTFEAAAAKRVLELTRVQLRMLAGDLQERGRKERAEAVLFVAGQIRP
jgi:predicted esterase